MSREREAGETMLKWLGDRAIVDIVLMPNGSVRISEACDCYFHAFINKKDVQDLISELQAIEGKMK